MQYKHDHVSEIRVSGYRSLANVKLPTNGLIVLIGENGSGKSSILHVLDILQDALSASSIYEKLDELNGNARNALRPDVDQMGFGISICGAEQPRIDYDTAFTFGMGLPEIESEVMRVQGAGAIPRTVFHRKENEILSADPDLSEYIHTGDITSRILLPPVVQDQSMPSSAPMKRFFSASRRIRIYPPQFVQERWRLVPNISSTIYKRCNEEGEAPNALVQQIAPCFNGDLKKITANPSLAGGISLSFHLSCLSRPIMADALSHGQLMYLSLLLLRLAADEASDPPAIMAFENPDLLVHPGQIVRLVWMLESMAKKCPVIVTTHSDALLDALDNPASCVVMCELDQDLDTHLLRVNSRQLGNWLDGSDYTGIGDLRRAGYLPHIFDEI